MEFFDIRDVRTESLTILLENGSVEKPKFERFHGKGFRVFKNGWGYYSGLVDDSEGIKLAERNIIRADTEGIDATSFSGKYEFMQKENVDDVSVEEKIQLLREIEKELKDSFIVNTRVGYIENKRRFHYRNSSGEEVEYFVPRVGVSIQAVAKDGSLQFLSKRLFRVGGFEVLTDEVFEMAIELREKLKDLVNALPPPSGRMPVLMDPSLGGVFIHEAFGHAVEADHLLKGASILKKTGIRVGPEELYVYDDPLMPEFGFFPYDDEGYKAEKKTIIESGVFKEFLHSRETAYRMNGRAGNARSQGVMEPIVRMSNTYIAEGSYSLDELLEEVKNGVYLIGSRGGETNPATGYFQFNAQYGYLIVNGEIRNMVRDVSLSGNTLEILKGIKIGKGVKFDSGFCGKSGQLVPVSDGAPPTVVTALVGGS
ncbi:putative Zn-dependent protease and their inactivated-like protein [Archaeoglobus sulfaticallidus PM70-1]|uniref:Putative Zn-dependent protease and their inactivated-like protein n=1 Tax=Archaeoglobus sulfaticallidus PM70-1 TaxID=387631 RepID=N0BN01_9EURY|nr:TldD/PmbA family protein [Archaeoglobus sulfaticallidus]AGK61665.1 putative Zn-dependent protease and their inactivated-like protein [Archaeoglobus sulfaticallidus PM70-1]